MIFYLIGIDYKTATLKERETAICLRKEIEQYWQQVSPGKFALLNTCNRTEIYAAALSKGEAETFAKSFKANFATSFRNAYFIYGSDKIFAHGLRLACGLESQLKGELQIMQQLETWFNQDSFPILLKGIWKKIIKAGKGIRTKSGLDNNKVNIAEIVFSDLNRNNVLRERTKVIIVGTGKIAEIIARSKHSLFDFIFVARREKSKSKVLARLAKGKTILYDELPKYLDEADVLIGATSSPHYILRADDFKNLSGIRKSLLYVYDLAMPRDFAEDVNDLSFVRKKDLNGLLSTFYQQNSYVIRCLKLAEKFIEEKAYEYKEYLNNEKYTNWLTAQPACAKTG